MKIGMFVVVAALAALNSGCASMGSLPPSAEQAGFDSGTEGKTGWSEYKEVATFPGVSLRTAFDAAKAGLGDAGFALRKADFDRKDGDRRSRHDGA